MFVVCGFKAISSLAETVWTRRAVRTAACTVTVVVLAMTEEVGRFTVLAAYRRQLHTHTLLYNQQDTEQESQLELETEMSRTEVTKDQGEQSIVLLAGGA